MASDNKQDIVESKQDIIEVDVSLISVGDDRKVKLSKVYRFEDKIINEINLSELENMTSRDLIQAEKVCANAGVIAMLYENNLYYNLVLAATATGLPVEFFEQLTPKDAMRVKNAVMIFLNKED